MLKKYILPNAQLLSKMQECSKMSVYQIYGQRKTQEDFWSSVEIGDGIYWHAVYDGHGGAGVARMICNILPYCIMKHLCENFDLTQKGWCRDVNKMRETIISAFHDTDMEIFKPDLIDTGCTCTGVLSVIGENLLFFVQLGDSHACLFGLSNDNPIIFSTKDHKPHNIEEKERIVASGGFVSEQESFWTAGNFFKPPSRVKGVLAVSRSFGDWRLENDCFVRKPSGFTYVYPKSCVTKTRKQERDDYFCMVSKTPDVSCIDLSQITNEKQICLLICSDGLTDNYKDMVIRSFLLNHEDDDQSFCTDKLENILENNNNFADNTTALVIIQNMKKK